jgi:hypothetical protein
MSRSEVKPFVRLFPLCVSEPASVQARSLSWAEQSPRADAQKRERRRSGRFWTRLTAGIDMTSGAKGDGVRQRVDGLLAWFSSAFYSDHWQRRSPSSRRLITRISWGGRPRGHADVPYPARRTHAGWQYAAVHRRMAELTGQSSRPCHGPPWCWKIILNITRDHVFFSCKRITKVSPFTLCGVSPGTPHLRLWW